MLARRLLDLLAIAMSLFQIYYLITVGIDPYLARIIHLAFGALIYLLIIYNKAMSRSERIFLLVLAGSLVAAVLYPILNFEYIVTGRFAIVTPLTLVELILGITLIIVLLYTLIGSAGKPFLYVVLGFMSYAFFGQYLPGILKHGGMTIQEFVDSQYLTSFGLFGMPIGVSLTYVFVFMLFGEFLRASGLGQLIMDIALGLRGTVKGGPTKIMVIGSALFGMISGSPVSSVMTVGTFTIPIAKRVGYSAEFAGAVEAVGSTGGQIMPPVMGSIAFLMVEYTGIPYSTIILYAFIPALVYYAALYAAVHFRACSRGYLGLPKEELPDWKTAVRQRGYLLAPVIILIILFMMEFSAPFAALIATGSVIIVSWLRKETRMGVKAILSALAGGAKTAAPLVGLLSSVGIIIGTFSGTGLGIRLSSLVLALSQENMFLMFLLIAITTTVLGLGLPPTACYIIQVAVSIPPMFAALALAGLSPTEATLIAHFFLMYYGCLAVITPPEAMASFVAAGLAGGDPMRTGFLAMRIALPIFIMPFLFVYRPEILFLGSSHVLIKCAAILLLFAGTVLMAAGFEGYLLSDLGRIERMLCFVSAIAMCYPYAPFNVFGTLVAVTILFISWRKTKGRSSLKVGC